MKMARMARTVKMAMMARTVKMARMARMVKTERMVRMVKTERMVKMEKMAKTALLQGSRSLTVIGTYRTITARLGSLNLLDQQQELLAQMEMHSSKMLTITMNPLLSFLLMEQVLRFLRRRLMMRLRLVSLSLRSMFHRFRQS